MNGPASWTPGTLDENKASFVKMVSTLEQLRSQIQTDIERLRPQWTTDDGKRSLGDLDQFFKNDYSKVQEAMNSIKDKYFGVAEIFDGLNHVGL